MKRCPKCNRVETDEALKFCRVDGATLVSDSGSVGGDTGTAKFGSPSLSSEIETSILPHLTDAAINRPTASTTVLPVAPAQGTTSQLTKPKRRELLLALSTLAAAIVIALGYFYFSRKSDAVIQSIAVMPFVNGSNDPNAEYLSDGISESLINNLSQLPSLRVIARTSTFKYKGKEIDPQEVAKTLSVGAIVTGRVSQHGNSLQISVELINAQDRTQMWGDQYNRPAADLQTVQSEIVRTISDKLRLRLTGVQEQRMNKQATTNAEAYQLYLNGVFYFRKGNIQNYQKALDYYNQAVTLDPKFALAYAEMPGVYANLTASGVDPKELLAKAKSAAEKAVELDDSLAEAHDGLAVIERDEWDWTNSEREFKRAIESNPNLASAHNGYAIYLAQVGRGSEGLAEIQRAEELDPLSTGYKVNEGIVLYFARRYDDATQVFQDVIKAHPDFSNAHVFVGYTYAAKGRYAEAIKEYQQDISIDGDTTSTDCYMGYALAKSGKRDEAQALLNKLKTTKEYVSPGELAALYVGLGDIESALQALERAYNEHDLQMQYLKVEPHYDSLRSDSRFQDLIRRVGLPQ